MPDGKPSKNRNQKKDQFSEENSQSECSTAEDADHDHTSSDADAEPSEVDIDESTLSNVAAAIQDPSSLPPISDICDMFRDLVGRVPQLKDVVDHLAGCKLRVATMCSGTESPILALELIQKSTSDLYGLDLDFEHVFSCEINAFKQAYIERNFCPPLLFRDVCEMGKPEAHTAYGALATVPGDIDVLLVGTSCVDFSNLNSKKKKINDKGQSGVTFFGMLSWVEKHRPSFVILENVCSAPWDDIKECFENINYSVSHTRVTKAYYIPHTRTRGYLIAVNERDSSIPETWKDWVLKKLKRPASSTLDDFLLPSDDPRIHQARHKLTKESNNRERTTRNADWARCESRHQRARLEEGLGNKRPLTNWEDGGSCKLLDFAWNDWGVTQKERVWDLMDISFLRSAKKGTDPCYKTQVWNLSQNVDRTIGSNKVGISTCLTPNMIPYITNRGGPMTGLEALSMQGLPIDRLLLTREREDQLKDLAGNAMSTTVVGACILAALVAGKELLRNGHALKTEVTTTRRPEVDSDSMAVDSDISPQVTTECLIFGEEHLHQRSVDLSSINPYHFSTLLADADSSKRLCSCEGRTDMTTRALLACKDCGTSFCHTCGSHPKHNPERIDVVQHHRMNPSCFAKELVSALPMCITLGGIEPEFLNKFWVKEGTDPIWSKWKEAVLEVASSEFRFTELKRQEIWSVIYQSPYGTLELSLHPKDPEWRVFALPKASEPANAKIRQVLLSPIGRLKCEEDLLKGQWQFGLPVPSTININVKGLRTDKNLAPSWEARLGLTGERFEDKKVYLKLKISVNQSDIPKLDCDISGTYELLPKCGTANGSLYKKVDADRNGLSPTFLFFDPCRTNDSEDCFVFSNSMRRLEYREFRPIVCKLPASWRPSAGEGEENVHCHLPCKWTPARSVRLNPVKDHNAYFGHPPRDLTISASENACSAALALLTCKVTLGGQAGPEWVRDRWTNVDKTQEHTTFRKLTWLLERVRHVDEQLSQWHPVDTHDHEDYVNCERCAPPAPQIKYIREKKETIAVEDQAQAGEHERRLKRRPNPFVTQLRLVDDKTGVVRIGINIPSLLHRAASRLPRRNVSEQITLSWRLDTSFTPTAVLELPRFTIPSNNQDMEHGQPPSFVLPLRKEQRRSLSWMIHRESALVEPFIEEEISEAVLAPLGWRAEGRAQRSVHTSGGVLADQVGYGKTAIMLGLIDCTAKSIENAFGKTKLIPGKIRVKASLILVPAHLTGQWSSEVTKFTDKRFKVVTIKTVTNLKACKIRTLQDADIIIVASSIFHSNAYLKNLRLLAAADAPFPSTDGRHFNAQLAKILSALKIQTDRLQHEGSLAVLKETKVAESRFEERQDLIVSDKDLASKAEDVQRTSDPLEQQGTSVNERTKGKAGPAPAFPPKAPKAVVGGKKKRKAFDDGKTPKKKKKPGDPWHLDSEAVQDWTMMQAPPFEMFHFTRIVVDEYTYLEGKSHALITSLTGDRKWVLSGTPPVHDFGALKIIAAFLDIHLGVHDIGEGQSLGSKKHIKGQSKAEEFHSFREVHTSEWHKHRNHTGQDFLNLLVRQNIAEIDEIPCEICVEKVVLPAAERAIYLELEHHLRALDMHIKRAKNSESDREKRLNKVLGQSKSAEEALLKRCSHFDLETSRENALFACDAIVHERQKQLDECEAQLLEALGAAVKQEKKLGHLGSESLFMEYVRFARNKGFGDWDASKMVIGFLDKSGAPQVEEKPIYTPIELTDEMKANSWAHREKTHEIRRLTKELVGRLRSLRFFCAVRDLQKQKETLVNVPCPACKIGEVPLTEVAVLSCCGHMGCLACVKEYAERGECVYSSVGRCSSVARSTNVVRGMTLGVDDKERDGEGRHYGVKLEKVADLINNRIPKDERVLVFVQFPDLMERVMEAFTAHNIGFSEIRGNAKEMSEALEEFKNEGKNRVLLLNVTNESASGANLTCANHAIFLSPLLESSQVAYTAHETQAIGRLVRYGQLKPVKIWKFVTCDTIDEEIYNERVEWEMMQKQKPVENTL